MFPKFLANLDCLKSTTLSALIHEMNAREARHIVTIEDPIEYEHTHNQRD